MVTSIYQEVELSLTENLIPVTVPVKQYDNKARKVRCVLYNNSVQYSVPQDCIVACSGTRPDGTIFHYTSETASDLVFVENGAVIFTITAFMTAQKLGKTVGVSESTVVRFASMLGFDGYPALQRALQELMRNKLTAVQRIEVTNDRLSGEDVLKQVLTRDMEKIRSTMEDTSEEESLTEPLPGDEMESLAEEVSGEAGVSTENSTEKAAVKETTASDAAEKETAAAEQTAAGKLRPERSSTGFREAGCRFREGHAGKKCFCQGAF